MTPRHSIICLVLALAATAPAPVAAQVSTAPCSSANLLAGKMPSQIAAFDGNAALVTDGAVAAEGAVWNAPAAVTSSSETGTLTYDLGAPQAIGALYLQADANDTYQVQGSTDGTGWQP